MNAAAIVRVIDDLLQAMTKTGLSPPQAAANLWFDLNGRG